MWPKDPVGASEERQFLSRWGSGGLSAAQPTGQGRGEVWPVSRATPGWLGHKGSPDHTCS